MYYRIFRLKDSLRNQFRISPHMSGPSMLKPKDYEPRDGVEASNAYAAWRQLQETASPLLVGDVLEGEGGKLEIFKFIGFEPAEWIIPEVKQSPTPADEDSGSAVVTEAQA